MMDISISNLVVDIEISSHCNANCYFCPRDSVPLLKHIELSVCEKVLDRLDALPVRPRLTFCGTGDSSVHPDIIFIVGRAVTRGYEVELVTNGIVVDRVFAEKLVNAGLQKISFSITEMGAAYEAIYKFPFERIVDNVLEFRKAAQEKCELRIHLIKELVSNRRLGKAREFWESKGIHHILFLDYTNRAGLLSLNNVDLDDGSFLKELRPHGVNGICPVPFKFIHIGADGTYYLCSHDFSRRVAFGHVSTHTIFESLALKLAYFQGDTAFCQSCTNFLANQAFKKVKAGASHQQTRMVMQHFESQVIKLVEDLAE